jgi:hypothetical protein
MRVKIKSASSVKGVWYNKLIGYEFNVVDQGENYKLSDNLLWIDPGDCEIVKEEEKNYNFKNQVSEEWTRIFFKDADEPIEYIDQHIQALKNNNRIKKSKLEEFEEEYQSVAIENNVLVKSYAYIQLYRRAKEAIEEIKGKIK